MASASGNALHAEVSICARFRGICECMHTKQQVKMTGEEFGEIWVQKQECL